MIARTEPGLLTAFLRNVKQFDNSYCFYFSFMLIY